MQVGLRSRGIDQGERPQNRPVIAGTVSCEDLRRSRQSCTDDEERAEQLEWRLSYPGTVCFEVKDHGLDYSVRLQVHPRRYKQKVVVLL